MTIRRLVLPEPNCLPFVVSGVTGKLGAPMREDKRGISTRLSLRFLANLFLERSIGSAEKLGEPPVLPVDESELLSLSLKNTSSGTAFSGLTNKRLGAVDVFSRLSIRVNLVTQLQVRYRLATRVRLLHTAEGRSDEQKGEVTMAARKTSTPWCT